jgi:hypothetical protein
MEIIAAFAAVGLLLAIAQRREQRALFPPQVCRSCPEMIHFDWRRRIWIHDDGIQYKPYPAWAGIESIDHPALPRP